jgi:hypothetical protein
MMQQEINIRIGSKAPHQYMASVLDAVADGTFRFGALTTREELETNLAENAIPPMFLTAQLTDFSDFLVERRLLMSQIIRRYYNRL